MFSKMENAKTLNALDEFAKAKPKDIPRELDEYLRYVATTGDPVYQWSLVKILFRQKLLNVIMEFNGNPSIMDIPLSPNLEPFNFENMKKRLLERYDTFSGVPFTIQRLAELLCTPKKQYSRLDKYMRALEKNIWVVSTRETAHREAEQTNLLNGALPIATSNNTSSSPEKLKRQPEAFDSEEDDEDPVDQPTPAEQFNYDGVVAPDGIAAEDSSHAVPLQSETVVDTKTPIPLDAPGENQEKTKKEPSNLDSSAVQEESIIIEDSSPSNGAKSNTEDIFGEVEIIETSSSNISDLEEPPTTPEEKDKTDEITVTEDDTDSSSKVTAEAVEEVQVQVPAPIIEPASDPCDKNLNVGDGDNNETVKPESNAVKVDLKRKIEDVVGEDLNIPNKKLGTELSTKPCQAEEENETVQEDSVSTVVAETEIDANTEEVEKSVEAVENIAEVEINELISSPGTAGDMESVTIEEKTEMVVEEADSSMDVDETSVMSVISSIAQEDVTEAAEPMEASEHVPS